MLHYAIKDYALPHLLSTTIGQHEIHLCSAGMIRPCIQMNAP